MARNQLYPSSVKAGIPKLGKLPENWKEVTFGDVLKTVERNVAMDNDTKYRLVLAKRNRGGIVPREILQGKRILTKTQYYIKKNDFLIAKRQIIHGACGVVPAELDGAIVSNEYSVLQTKKGLLLDYLKYFSHTIYFQQTCFQASVGVDVEKMIFRISDWFKYKVHLPPFYEQQKILDILSTWDRAIDRVEKLIDLKIQRKKALMQQLLTGKKRFNEFENEKWKEFHIKEIGEVITGSTPPKKNYNNYGGNIPWVTATDLKYKYIKESNVNVSFEGKKYIRIVPEGSILVTCIASIGKNSIAGIDLATNQQINSIVVQKDFNNELIYYLIEYNKKKLLSLAGVTAVPIVNKREFEMVKLRLPLNIDVQKKMASVLRTADDEIQLLMKQLDAIKKQNRGLMQKLLTGKIRVKVKK